jgi:hypothetical protein
LAVTNDVYDCYACQVADAKVTIFTLLPFGPPLVHFIGRLDADATAWTVKAFGDASRLKELISP